MLEEQGFSQKKGGLYANMFALAAICHKMAVIMTASKNSFWRTSEPFYLWFASGEG